MKIASVAAAALIAAFALSGTASAKDLVAPQTTQAAKTAPRVTEPKRPAKRPILDSMSTQSIIRTDGKKDDARKAPAGQGGIMVNPWIVPNFL